MDPAQFLVPAACHARSDQAPNTGQRSRLRSPGQEAGGNDTDSIRTLITLPIAICLRYCFWLRLAPLAVPSGSAEWCGASPSAQLTPRWRHGNRLFDEHAGLFRRWCLVRQGDDSLVGHRERVRGLPAKPATLKCRQGR